MSRNPPCKSVVSPKIGARISDPAVTGLVHAGGSNSVHETLPTTTGGAGLDPGVKLATSIDCGRKGIAPGMAKPFSQTAKTLPLEETARRGSMSRIRLSNQHTRSKIAGAPKVWPPSVEVTTSMVDTMPQIGSAVLSCK